VLAGCGAAEQTEPGGASVGAEVFRSAGCGGCHTLRAADATGTVGPDLDSAQVTADDVSWAVRDGRPGMPAFRGRLTAREIRAVARFVAQSDR